MTLPSFPHDFLWQDMFLTVSLALFIYSRFLSKKGHMEQTGARCNNEPWLTLRFAGNVPCLGTIFPTATVLASTFQEMSQNSKKNS